MKYIYNDSTDAYFNLAAEEYLINHFDDEVFMLWRNDNAVIVGKNQNTLSEINLDYVEKNGIKVVRRMTGGGAVFHDLGNVNYTFIVNGSEHMTDFGYFTAPVINALAKLGIKAELSGRNDILIDGKKFSGNAQYSHGGRTLHHGTLMLSASFDLLKGALNVSREKIESKGIKSVSSRVTNISEHLSAPITPLAFITHLRESILSVILGAAEYVLTNEDKAAIQKLSDEKYSTWEWNYGYSPKYTFTKKTKFSKGIIEVFLNVENGIITDVSFKGDFFGSRDVGELENRIRGLRHEKQPLTEMLYGVNTDAYIWGMDPETLADSMF